MAQIFEPLYGLLIDETSVCFDNSIFKIHYKLTVAILMTCSLLVSYTQYFGNPIDCIPSGNVPSDVMNVYCWIHPTFTLPKKLHGRIGKDFVQPGVTSHTAGEDEVKLLSYYQWVPIVLFLQAKLFFIPFFIWKYWENGIIKSLISSDEKFIKKFSFKRKWQMFYAIRFFFCEFLNFINVIAQMYFINSFLGGEFSKYGLEVISFTVMDPNKREDPMSRVFPKVSKCTFYKYGPSGSIVNFDGLCVLPLNILNEKIYVFIWFWFIFIAILSLLSLVFDAVVIIFPKFRIFLLKIRTREIPLKQLEIIVNKCFVGDWFILYQISKNIPVNKFKNLIEELENNKKLKNASEP